MRTVSRLLLPVLVLATVSCSSGGNSPNGGSAAAGRTDRPTPPAGERVADFTPPLETVPDAVRAIEDLIDRPSVILAGEAEVYVSKNYQFEVGLAGDDVTPDLDRSGINERIAMGNAVATVRNLQIRCDQRIRVRIADFGSEPFIRVAARGHCSHLTAAEAKTANDVKRSDAILIRNDSIRYVSGPEALGITDSRPAASK